MARRIDTDVLIIGSGALGATYARLLAGSGRKITMIDAGAQMSKRPGEHLLNAFVYQHQPNLALALMYSQNQLLSIPQEPYKLETPSGPLYNPPLPRTNWANPRQNPNFNMPNAASAQVVGGAFAAWSGFAPTPQPFERTPLIPSEEWEISLDIANALFQTRTDAFEPSAVNRALKQVIHDKLSLELQNMPVGAKFLYKSDQAWFVRWTGSDTILGPLLDENDPRSKDFTLLPQHRAEALVAKGGRIESVRVRDLTLGEEIEAHAQIVVVAGNAFLTPRLLWQSGIRPEALGRYLAENIIATSTVGLNGTVIEQLRADSENPASGSRRTVPIDHNDPPPKSGFAPTPQKPWIGHVNRTARYLYYTQASWDSRLTLDLTWYGCVRQNPDNRLLFDDKMPDRFGQPQLTFEYRLARGDADTAEAMVEDLNQVATTIGAYMPIQTSTLSSTGASGPYFQPAGASFHWMGTYRMGAKDDGTSVVDSGCKVWGFDNLYLGGSGVMPETIASNCTLAAAAIAAVSCARVLDTPLAQLAKEAACGESGD
jgi:pyranose oxidase